jgi:protein-disulfide isomerase
MRTYVVLSAIVVGNIVLALGFFSAGFYVRGLVDRGPAPTVQPEASLVGSVRVSNVSADDDPARGPEDAPVTIIEFSDFQCPFCKAFFDQTLPKLLSRYRDRVRFVYRDFPITRIHPEALNAAEAAQCAFEQDRFWDYHDRLFQTPEKLSVSHLKANARSLGLDGKAFDECLDSGHYSREVKRILLMVRPTE